MRAPRLAISSLAPPLVVLLGTPACARAAAPTAPAPAPMSLASDAGATGTAAPRQPWAPPVDVFAPPADAERDPSGVARKILARGKGTSHPSPETYVDLHYAGWERNGRQFEGTAPDGPPRRYDVKELAEAMRTELGLMVVGDKRRIWVPAALAYAKRTNFSNAPKGDMTFEIELLRIVPLPPVPESVGAAPKGVKTTKSGLAYLMLKKGTGTVHPKETTRAQVIYAAWKPSGEMFQTSLISGDSIPVRVKLLPPGWREAMLKMVEGDKWRLWLPGKLAFGELAPGQEALPFGPPPGPVVFDVELLKILADDDTK